jgi:hypothetical protein
VEAALCKWFRTPPNKNMVDGIVDAVMSIDAPAEGVEGEKRGKRC